MHKKGANRNTEYLHVSAGALWLNIANVKQLMFMDVVFGRSPAKVTPDEVF